MTRKPVTRAPTRGEEGEGGQRARHVTPGDNYPASHLASYLASPCGLRPLSPSTHLPQPHTFPSIAETCIRSALSCSPVQVYMIRSISNTLKKEARKRSSQPFLLMAIGGGNVPCSNERVCIDCPHIKSAVCERATIKV